MKKLIVALLILSSRVLVFSQGTILFDNRVPGIVDARFFAGDQPMGNNWTAQLFVGEVANTGSLKPVFPTTTFKTSAEADMGYVIPVVVVVPDRPPGSVVGVQMRAFVKEQPSVFAVGLPLAIRLGGDGFPPAYLEGLLPVNFIPEPSTLALAALGGFIALAFAARKQQ